MRVPRSLIRSLRSLRFLALIFLAGCVSTGPALTEADFPVEQDQIRHRLDQIIEAVEKGELDRLDSYHFYGPKFTKFSPGSAVRQDAASARQGEHAGLNSIKELKMEAENLKIDVFGEVGVATFVVHSTFILSGNRVDKRDRATLVFAKVRGEWGIVHEHLSSLPSGS